MTSTATRRAIWFCSNWVQFFDRRLRCSDIFGRWGGEEFVFVLVENSLNEALAACDQLRRDIAARSFGMDCCPNLKITVSMGLANVCGRTPLGNGDQPGGRPPCMPPKRPGATRCATTRADFGPESPGRTRAWRPWVIPALHWRVHRLPALQSRFTDPVKAFPDRISRSLRVLNLLRPYTAHGPLPGAAKRNAYGQSGLDIGPGSL